MTNNLSDREISELICTRISHDIIGNIGAVSNAVELLEEGDMDFLDDIKSILKTSSFVLSSRMKFFRLVFGNSSLNLANADFVKKTLLEYMETLSNGKYPIKVDFEVQNADFVKMALLCAMVVGDTFVRGGEISIKQDGDKLLVISDNNSLVKDKIFIIKEVINGKNNDNLAQYTPILYLKQILKDTNYSLSTTENDNLDIIIS